MKDIYGSATAPRNLWQELDCELTGMGGIRIWADSCLWDDFNRGGDLRNERWLEIRKKIDEKFKRGTVRLNSYRHIGVDVNVVDQGEEFYVELEQKHLRGDAGGPSHRPEEQ